MRFCRNNYPREPNKTSHCPWVTPSKRTRELRSESGQWAVAKCVRSNNDWTVPQEPRLATTQWSFTGEFVPLRQTQKISKSGRLSQSLAGPGEATSQRASTNFRIKSADCERLHWWCHAMSSVTLVGCCPAPAAQVIEIIRFHVKWNVRWQLQTAFDDYDKTQTIHRNHGRWKIFFTGRGK